MPSSTPWGPLAESPRPLTPLKRQAQCRGEWVPPSRQLRAWIPSPGKARPPSPPRAPILLGISALGSPGPNLLPPDTHRFLGLPKMGWWEHGSAPAWGPGFSADSQGGNRAYSNYQKEWNPAALIPSTGLFHRGYHLFCRGLGDMTPDMYDLSPTDTWCP